jgi:hypothetical protein
MQTQVLQSNYKYTAGQCYKRKPLNDDLMPLENMGFGLGVVRSQVSSNSCRLPNMNSFVVTISADMVAGDILTGVLKFISPDGTTSTVTINETFATNHLTTVTQVKNDLEAISGVTCTLSGSNRVLTIVAAADKRIQVATAIGMTNGGSGTAVITSQVKGTTDSIRGVTSRDPNAPTVLDYTYTEPYHKAKHKLVGVTFQGDPAVPVAGTPAAGGAVYCLLEDYTDTGSVLNPRGSFRTNTDSSAAPVVLVSDTEFADEKDNGLAPLSMNKL